MDFVTGLPISANWKSDSYELILVIVERLMKMVHYELVNIMINAPGLAKVIINMIVRHHGVLESILTDWGLLFTSKFWFLLCYFLGIKKKLFTIFQYQTDGQTERQKSTMEAYLIAFVYWEQDDSAKLLLMAKFAYNSANNASTRHSPFELNCSYHRGVFFEEDVDFRSRSFFANELVKELRGLMEVCYQKLFYVQKLQKKAHDKEVKSRSYAPSEKVWLNSKYIKTMRNKNLESKFFGPFQVFHAVEKQVYKLKPSTK